MIKAQMYFIKDGVELPNGAMVVRSLGNYTLIALDDASEGRVADMKGFLDRSAEKKGNEGNVKVPPKRTEAEGDVTRRPPQ